MRDRVCEACGKDVTSSPSVALGGTILCRQCHADILEEIDELRAQGKPVDVMRIARRMYRESHKRSQITINLQPELIDAVDKRAQEEGRSRSNMAAELIKRQLAA